MQEITEDPQFLPGHLLSEQIVICTQIFAQQIFAQQIFALPCIGNPPFFTPLSLLLHLRLSDDLKRFVLTFQPPNSTNIFLLWVEDCLDFLLLLKPLPGWAQVSLHSFAFLGQQRPSGRGNLHDNRRAAQCCPTLQPPRLLSWPNWGDHFSLYSKYISNFRKNYILQNKYFSPIFLVLDQVTFFPLLKII